MTIAPDRNNQSRFRVSFLFVTFEWRMGFPAVRSLRLPIRTVFYSSVLFEYSIYTVTGRMALGTHHQLPFHLALCNEHPPHHSPTFVVLVEHTQQGDIRIHPMCSTPHLTHSATTTTQLKR